MDDAKENWLKSIELDSRQPDAYLNLGNFEILVTKNPREAIRYFRKALELAPEDAEIMFNLAVALDRQDDHLQEALDLYRRVKHQMTTHPEYTKRLDSLDAMIRNIQARLIVQNNQNK